MSFQLNDSDPAVEPRPAQTGRASRRQVLAAGAAVAATAALPSTLQAQLQSDGAAASAQSVGMMSQPMSASLSRAWRDPVLKLARRITHGLTPALIAEARAKGYTRFLEEQLNPMQIDDSDCEMVLRQEMPRLFLSVPNLQSVGDEWATYTSMQAGLMHRMVWSKRQLYWRMVDFWMDHFNVYVWKAGPNITLEMWRTAIMRHAMGNFHNLLRAVCHSGGMLIFLDNTDSQGERPNVNFARELMELHTIGVDGGQVQADMRPLAQCFTGWTTWFDGPDAGRFRYEEWRHWPGDKRVLGRTIPFTGKTEGDAAIKMLFEHPSCARFIATKLCRWFLDYEPNEGLVERAAQTFRATRGDIRSVLRVILQQPNVVAAKPKLKRPNHLVASALRATGTWMVEDYWSIRDQHLGMMGHQPWNWEPADGYPDRVQFWSSAMIPRIRFSMRLGNNQVGGIRNDIEQKIGPTNDPDRIVAILNRELFGGEMEANDLGNVRRFLRARPISQGRKRAAISLALSSHSFHWF